MFLKLEFLNFFYYTIFGSVILKLLFLKTGFFCFVILKLLLKNISNSASSFIIDCKKRF
ncbi:membrane protein [Helicobacter pylori]|nr:membrane protein [Helicobacter pylori]